MRMKTNLHKNLRLSPLFLAMMAVVQGAAAADGATASATGAADQAQPAQQQSADSQNAKANVQRGPSSTSNTTTANDTRSQQMQAVEVSGQSLTLGGGLMSVQSAAKAVSTITRDAITQAAPGANYAQVIASIPGVVSITDDVTGLNDGNYSVRGFTNDEVGVTVNGAPINDSGNYRVYPTEYGDTENMGDVTVLQGYPDVDQPVAGAAGGTIAWATLDPSHIAGVDFSVSGGSHDYEREFVRFNTGDTGPVRSWVSISNNSVDLWRGAGNAQVTKIDGKSVWTINDDNYISASIQYNREQKYAYETLSKAQANANYYANYDTVLASPTDTYYWKLHTNPYRSYLFSMDGEFRLADTLRLSIVPYFQYGDGGGGSGTTFTESTNPANADAYRYSTQDLNYDGTIGGKALVYGLSQNITYRPGVIAKFIQELGQNDTLAYGIWLDRPREEQNEAFADAYNGVPADIWLQNQGNLLRSANGQIQYAYNEYTESDLRRVFATNTWTPTDQWTFTLGAAYTWEQRKGWDYEFQNTTSQFGGAQQNAYHKVTPTAGVKYQLNEENQFYLGYGQTFRAPINGAVMQNGAVLSYYEQNPKAPPLTPAQLAAISNNRPETADTLDAGWRYYADRFSASVDAYASNLKNKQVSGYDENSNQTVYVTVNELHQRGLNGEVSYKVLDDVTLYGSYAYTKSTIEGNTATFGDGTYPTNGKSFVDTPKNSGFFRVNYDHGPFWTSLDVAYHSAMWGDWVNTEKVGGFTTVNWNSGWRFDDFAPWFKKPEIKLNVFNLLDKHALTFDSATTFLANKGPANLDGTGNPLYVNGAYYNLLEPRTFMVTLSASFF
jgi:iron complex outermembrane receptor protein